MNPRFLLILTLPAMVAGALPASAAITHLAAVDRTALMQGKFDVVHATSAIPKAVRDEFAKQTGSTNFWMADPTEQFQSGGNPSNNLPYYRLVFGAESVTQGAAGPTGASTDDYYIIEALRGGASPGSEVFLFKLTPNKPADIPFVIHQVHGPVAPSQSAPMIIDHSPASAKLIWIADEDQTTDDLDAVRKAVAADKMNDSSVDLVGNKTNPQDPGVGAPVNTMPTLTKSW